MSILPSENPRIVNTSLAPHTCDSWGIDFSLVRYFTILGFSDGRIVALFQYRTSRMSGIGRAKIQYLTSVDVIVIVIVLVGYFTILGFSDGRIVAIHRFLCSSRKIQRQYYN
jgi:hypothetical protein